MREVQEPASDNSCTSMKIVLMCTIPATASSFFLPLARELKNNGYDVAFCFAHGSEVNAISSEGFQVQLLSIRRKPFSLGNIIAVVQMVVFLRRNNVKVIETSTPVASLVGRLAAVLSHVPVRINTIRGMFPRETHRWQSMLFDSTEKILHRINSYTITINERDKEELLEKGFAEQNKIANIGCGGVGIDTKEFDPYRFDSVLIKEMKTTFGIRENDFVVTYIGRLTEEKGIIDLVEVLTVLLEENRDIKGLIVGDALKDEHKTVSRAILAAMLLDNGISNEVFLTGHRDDIPELIAISDVIVLPSKREGFGMVLAEAAAMAKPVIAYRCRGVEEAVIDGKTGFIIEPGNIEGFADMIQYLHDNKNIAMEIGEAARAEAKNRFSQEVILERYLAIFTEAIHAKLS